MSSLPGRSLEYIKRYRDIVDDFDCFVEAISRPLNPSIRANTLLIDPDLLASRLEKRGFKLRRVPWHRWFFIVDDPELAEHPGRSLEHLLGYYYVQELSSALPPIVLDPKPGDLVLDMAAAPGSKTTQMAQMMKGIGTIVANDVSSDRIGALRSNIDRLRVTNVILTREDSRSFRSKIKYPKILLDAPCSSEGTVRKDPSHLANLTMTRIRRFSSLQKALVRRSYDLLEPGGVLVYSVCTFAPEEAEDVVSYAIDLGLDVEGFELPVMSDPGVVKWVDEKGRVHEYHKKVERTARVWPHLNDTGGMFIAKLRKPGGRLSQDRGYDIFMTDDIHGTAYMEPASKDDLEFFNRYFESRFGVDRRELSSYIVLKRGRSFWAFSGEMRTLEVLDRVESAGIRALNISGRIPKPTTSFLRLIGNRAKRNITSLRSYSELVEFMSGGIVRRKFDADPGFVIVKYGDDVLGCGMYSPRLGLVSQLPKYMRAEASWGLHPE